MDELRLAIRRLTKRPGASIVSIVTLACAIGAASATWSLLSAVLLRPLPYAAPERLVTIWETSGSTPRGFASRIERHRRRTLAGLRGSPALVWKIVRSGTPSARAARSSSQRAPCRRDTSSARP